MLCVLIVIHFYLKGRISPTGFGSSHPHIFPRLSPCFLHPSGKPFLLLLKGTNGGQNSFISEIMNNFTPKTNPLLLKQCGKHCLEAMPNNMKVSCA